jgi:hypothetical protein
MKIAGIVPIYSPPALTYSHTLLTSVAVPAHNNTQSPSSAHPTDIWRRYVDLIEKSLSSSSSSSWWCKTWFLNLDSGTCIRESQKSKKGRNHINFKRQVHGNVRNKNKMAATQRWGWANSFMIPLFPWASTFCLSIRISRSFFLNMRPSILVPTPQVLPERWRVGKVWRHLSLGLGPLRVCVVFRSF